MPSKIDIDEKEFAKDWVDGMSIANMCAKYGYSADSSVRTRALSMGLHARPKGRPKRLTDSDFAESSSAHSLTGGNWRFDPFKRIYIWVPDKTA